MRFYSLVGDLGWPMYLAMSQRNSENEISILNRFVALICQND